MNKEIFVSYSHKDKIIADSVVQALEENGITCWYAPRDIKPEESATSSIEKAIRQTKIFVLVFTNFSNTSEQVAREVEIAINSKKIVVPFKLTDELPSTSMEYFLSTLHWLEATDKPLDESIDGLKRLIKALLSKEEADSLQSQKNIKRTKRKKHVLVLTCFIAAIFSLIAYAGWLRRSNHSEENRNTNKEPEIAQPSNENLSNCESGGLAVRSDDGKYVYYIDYKSSEAKSKDSKEDSLLNNSKFKIRVSSYEDFIANKEGEILYELDDTAASLAINENFLYFQYKNNSMYRIDLKTKKMENVYNHESFYYLSCGEGILFLDLTDHKIKFIYSDDLSVFTFEDTFAKSFTIWDGAIYYASYDGEGLFKYIDGKSELISEGTIDYIIGQEDYFFFSYPNCVSSDIECYTLKQEFNLLKEEAATFQLIKKDDCIIYLDSNDGYLYSFNINTNELIRLSEEKTMAVAFIGDCAFLTDIDYMNKQIVRINKEVQ